jgi:acyl-CoA hydrolase
MEKTKGDSEIIISHVMLPQDTNSAGNVHGGSIMKLIDTAAGVVAVRHARSNAVTASIDRVDFHYTVYIGNRVTL